jgi:hypothetical protein
MFTNPSKYYTKYNKNIKDIKGSGVVTPRGPRDTNNTTDTVKETLHDDIIYMPPLYLRTWDNDEQNTNGYLNQNDYVDYVPDIDKYYYTTQQLDNVVVKKRSEKNSNNPTDPIKLPPPLVTTKPNIIFNNKSKINNNQIQTQTQSQSQSDYNNIDGNAPSDFGINTTNVNKNWYDGRYLYTFSPSSLNTIYPWTSYKLLYPFDSPSNTLKYYQNSDITDITGNPLLRANNPKQIEKFESTNSSEKTSCSTDYNILYLTILCVLIIIYFIKSNK